LNHLTPSLKWYNNSFTSSLELLNEIVDGISFVKNINSISIPMDSERQKVREQCTFLGLLLAVLFYASCSKKEGTSVTPQLSVSPSQVSFPADGGTIGDQQALDALIQGLQ
jgi:hypothetical protein